MFMGVERRAFEAMSKHIVQRMPRSGSFFILLARANQWLRS
jgi:hypothetical protein